jgi:sulfite exporter TauE/SafE
VDFALIASGALLGLAGLPHCTAMCSAPCAAAVGAGGRGSRVAFQLARVMSYAVGGAIVASSVAALASWSQFSPALRPLWTLLNAAALVLGAWLLWRGRQPAWLARLGLVPALPALAAPSAQRGGWQSVRLPVRAAGAGAAWVVWPCGLLQSALVLAALSSSALGGAATMAVFALASAPGLVAGPWIVRRLLSGRGAAAREAWAARAAGLMLLGASAWALGHQLGPQVAAYCRTL